MHTHNKFMSFFKFLLGVIGILMLAALILGFWFTTIFLGVLASDYNIDPLIVFGGYIVVAIFLIWYGFHS